MTTRDLEQTGYFVYRLIPPRPTFDLDMSAGERKVMGQHVAYWQHLTDQGRVLIFGPVHASSGAWGLAIVNAHSEGEVEALAHKDPAVSSGLATFEVGTMTAAVLAHRETAGKEF